MQDFSDSNSINQYSSISVHNEVQVKVKAAGMAGPCQAWARSAVHLHPHGPAPQPAFGRGFAGLGFSLHTAGPAETNRRLQHPGYSALRAPKGQCSISCWWNELWVAAPRCSAGVCPNGAIILCCTTTEPQPFLGALPTEPVSFRERVWCSAE